MADLDPLDATWSTSAAPQADPLDASWDEMARKRAGLALVASRNANPDQAGQANALARATGLPADVVQRNLAEVQARQRAQANQTILGKYPVIADWATNPRNAAVAHDDLPALSRVGDSITALTAPAPTIWNTIKGLGTAFSTFVPSIRALAADYLPSFDIPHAPGVPGLSAVSNAVPEAARALDRADASTPDFKSWWARDLYSGTSSLIQMAPGIVGSIAARSPAPAIAMGGLLQGVPAYAKYRARGGTRGQAAVGGSLEGGAEALGEVLPMGWAVSKLGKIGMGEFLSGLLGRELPSEIATTIAQDATDTAIANPGKTWGQFAAALPADIRSTAVGVLMNAGLFGVIHHVAQKHEVDHASTSATFTDNLMAQAAKAKTRERDPQAFRDFIAAHTEGTPVENAYVPGEKLREFFQSDRFDPEDASHQWLGGLSDQANEAAALGGDVVIPLADAATHLAGSTAWDAIKDDVRVTPGGLSAREAKDYAESHADAMEQLGKQAEEAYRADQEARAPVEKVYEDVRQRLVESGQPLDAANHLAQLYAAHAQAWGARLGTDALAYHEQTAPEFKQILPPALAKVQAADQTDLLINALKGGAEGTKAGPSLLDFISKAGGVEDKSGDIASMGGDKWHREKAFRKRLIREGVNQEEALPGMGGGIGAATGYGLDDVAQRAWEAGYFPNTTERPTTNELLDAIGQELRGSPVHAQAQVEQQQHIADAVQELRGILEQRGVDAEKATRETIRQELQRYSQEQAGGRGYEQTYNEGVRGRATFSSGKPLIELFQAADLSTIVHETGHVWLEELRAIAERDDAPADVKADWQSVQDWFAANGHAMQDGMIPTEAHELWARGFERFAMEGKAPSSALRRAFDAFRSWLLNIYKVVDNLRAPITPEIRDVMNRMIATQEEIDQAEEVQNLKALFTDAAQAGMTEEEFAAYQASTQDARNEAYDALIYKTMHAIRKARTKEWKADEATVKADVTDRINKRPEFRALHLLRTGKWLGEPDREGMKVRLDRQWLVDSYGNEALSMLPKGVPPIYGEKGANADELAELTGFRTGDEMVRMLMGLETAQKAMRDEGDKRSVKQRLIDEETAQEMRDRYGDPLNDGSIEEEALAAVHNDRQGELIASEARALTRKTGGAPTPYRVAREWASRKIAEGKVVDVASRSALQRYARTAAKAAKAAEAAILKGDVDETFRQKQAQLLNHALLVEAKKAADEVDVAVSRLGKIAKRATMRSVDQDYLDRAHALLEKFDFRPASQKGLNEREGFAEWAAAQRANGIDIVTPPRLDDRGEHYSRISVEELRGLRDSVDQLVHLGRLKQKLIDAKEQRDFDEVVDEAVQSASNLPPRTPSDNMAASGWEKFKTRIASADAALLKVETIVDRLDGGNSNGVFNRLVFRPLADAQDRSRAMMAEKIGEHQALLKLVPNEQLKRWSDRVTIPELVNRATGNPWVMTRDQLVQMALNMGNAGNADKLARGYGWDEGTVMRVLDRELTKEEWQHVQAELDLVGSLWPQIEAMYKRLNGVAPEKIEARPIETRHGTFAGGYFPVIYDPTKDATAEAQAAAAGDKLFENIYTRAATANGFTEARTNVARPINLSYGLTSRHLAEVIHDLTHREAVINADKFLSDRRVVKAIRDTMGPEVQKQFRPWLQHIANEMALDKRGLAGWEHFAKKLRTNTSIMGMGYRFSVIASQIAGYTNSAEQIGSRWMASGFKQAANPSNWGAVIERSPEVRARLETLDRDIQDNIKSLLGDHSPIAKVKRFAFTGIGWMDRVVVIPTWLGAYNKAQSEGMADEDAVYYADKIVRNSQGANAAKDLASVQRGAEFWKLTTMFYSYASAFVNRQHSLAWDTADAVRERRAGAAPELVARAWWLFAAAPLMQALLTGHGPGEDEDWGSWAFWNMLSNFFMGVPLVRDITGAVSSGYGYSYTPVERAIGTVFKDIKDAKHLWEGDEAPLAPRHAIESAGYVAGLPLGQIAAAVQFAIDVGNGDQDPQSAADWYRGITTGRTAIPTRH